MEKVFVRDLVPDVTVDTLFLVKSMQVSRKRNGEEYVRFVLCDRTGEINAVQWDGVAETVDSIGGGDYAQVTGRVGQYRDQLQLTIQRMIRIEPEMVDEADFIASSERDAAKMWSELEGVIAGIGNEHLRRLLEALFAEGDLFARDGLAEGFRKAPAAKGHHHVYLGGLLEHTLSMARLAVAVCQIYAELDADLLMAGVLLHDIGKVSELSYSRQFEYTDEGELLGHIVMAAAMLDRRARELDFPDDLRVKLMHLIVSHHGEEEFGSPRRPKMPEAMALHYIDMLDSRLGIARKVLERDAGHEGNFTAYDPGLETRLYKG